MKLSKKPRFSTGRNLDSSIYPRFSSFQTMPVFVWLLWVLISGRTLGGPVQRAAWSEGLNTVITKQDGASRPSFYRLPMFQHAPGPLVARELFRPVPQNRALPAGLTALLLPPTIRHQSIQGTGARAVEVWCGIDQISVRVDRFQLRAWTVPSLFRLGSCEASRISPSFLYFHYRLTECYGESKVGTTITFQISKLQTHSSLTFCGM